MITIPTKALRQGVAVGGPLEGDVLTTDYPKGILLVDRIKNLSWLYDWNSVEEKFYCRGEETLTWLQDAQYNVRRAMEENNYEVRSHPLAGDNY